MTALATNMDRQHDSGGETLSLDVAASVEIFAGSAVVANASGYAKAAGPAAGEKMRGVSIDYVDNTAGANAAEKVRVLSGRSFRFTGSGFARTNVGDRVWLVDDNTVTLVKGDVVAGIISRFESSTAVYVYVPPAATIDEMLSDDSTAIHEDTAGEIAGVTAKNPAVAGDLLLIEDSAAANVKKRIQAQHLPVAVAATSNGLMSSADKTKLDGVEALADVTDLTNVTTALGTTAAAAVATTNVGAGDAGKLLKLDGTGKAAGRVLETDGAKLDLIEAAADVTDLTNVTTALGVTAAVAVAASAGAGDSGKAAKLDGAGLWDASMIPAGGDSTALHDNVAAEISAITEKSPAVAADLLVIEDSAAANVKKRVQAQNLPVAVAAVSNGLMSSADKTKLDGVEALADVTDLANVTTALGVTAAAAVATSAGAADAGKAVKLDAGGELNISMIPLPTCDVQTAAVAAGAPSQAEIVAAAATYFGDAGAAAAHAGQMFVLDDNDSTASFLCFAAAGNWYYTGTIGA